MLASDWSKNGCVDQSWPMRWMMKPTGGLSDDIQGFLWPLCHHSKNEANTLGRTELREVRGTATSKIQDAKDAHQELIHIIYELHYLLVKTNFTWNFYLHAVQNFLSCWLSPSLSFRLGDMKYVRYWISFSLSFISGTSFLIGSCEDLMRKQSENITSNVIHYWKEWHTLNTRTIYRLYWEARGIWKRFYPELLEL